jgi:hypothetical protein
MTRSLLSIAALTVLCLSALAKGEAEALWPPVTRESRPWAYNWWLGSAVDEGNLARELSRYREGGLGGVHIVPIYGAKGAESRYVEYLSPRWMELLAFTVREAEKNDMGVDMTTGTGWCFGGPNITEETATLFTLPRVAEVPAGTQAPWQLEMPKTTIRAAHLIAATALGPNGERMPLSDKDFEPDGRILWQPPSDGWKLAFLAARRGVDVKRAAPGGQGPQLNPILPEAMKTYLERFTKVFADPEQPRPRAMYHDSYEYYASIPPFADGEWSPRFFEDFQRLRGYDLRPLLPELAGEGDQETVARVRGDYRRTVSELTVDEVFPQWTQWCRERGILTRNQAHGAPADNYDFYTIADIPECEIFLPDPGTFETPKFASSAAHVAGRKLVSAETGTWLDEHFNETFAQMKRLVDELFVRGVNHIFYHGCVYSPDDAPWPGWLFYASTQMNPRNPLWREAAAFNDYVSRVQSVLQAGQPANDVLIYNAMDDGWHGGKHFAAWRSLGSQPARKLGDELWKKGFQFDWISSRWIQKCRVEDGLIAAPGGKYKALVVPPLQRMPVETARAIADLAKAGGTIIVSDKLPADVPGLHKLEERREELASLNKILAGLPDRVLVGPPLQMLSKAGISPEPLVAEHGVELIRRSDADGDWYFLFNPSAEKTIDTEARLARPFSSLAILDPVTGRHGLSKVIDGSFRLVLEPRGSLVLRTFRSGHQAPESLAQWQWWIPGKEIVALKGPWTVEFLEGGPSLPATWQPPALASWTTHSDPVAEAFAGTALYRTSFNWDGDVSRPVLFDLGEVLDVARLRVNGKDLGVRFAPPYRWILPAGTLTAGKNDIQVEVTNVAANRIRDLDRRGVEWKYFHDVNVLSSRYRNLNATEWPVRPAGLLGPVTLYPQESPSRTPLESHP